jgi:ribonuclease BN (tRNA processing enzyme)
MRLTVLGAGPAYTDRQGASGACYLVSEGTTHVLLDLGQGSFPRIFPHVAPPDLAAVVVTHLHPDTSSTSCR